MNLNAVNDPERLRAAKACLAGLLKGRPDASVENPKYHIEMVEVLAHLSADDLAVLSHPVTGLQTVLKYLPTPADVNGFLRDHHSRRQQFEPIPTSYRKLNDEPKGPWDEETDYERKRRVVRELLGYNPDTGRTTVKASHSVPTEGEVKDLNLKMPSAPPSKYLKAKLLADGYFDHLRRLATKDSNAA